VGVQAGSERPALPIYAVSGDTVRQALAALLGQAPTRSRFRWLARRMSATAGRARPWTWRYVYSVHRSPAFRAGRAFSAAAVALAAELIDGASPFSAWESREVFVPPGSPLPSSGGIVMGQRKDCPVCGQVFVPNVPWRTKCPACSPHR